MALKKKASKSKEEQLYMLEIFIDQLNLCQNKISNVNSENVIVCVKFVDLVPYEINTLANNNQGKNEKENREPAQNFIDFKCGKSCLFAKTPNNLTKVTKSMPLSAEVYFKKSIGSKENQVLLCGAKMALPDSMRDQIIAAKGKIEGLPTPYTLKNTLDLVDEEGDVAGSISIILRLSCFGSSIIKHFSLNEKSFVLQSAPFREKFLCSNFDAEASQNGKHDDSKSMLKRPTSPPRIALDDPGFKDLTTAEKLNDPKYREAIYRTYPNEPTCCCLPVNRSTHPLMCRSGCSRSCCMKLRDPKILETKSMENDQDILSRTYCTNDLQRQLLPEKADACNCSVTRLRGGGDVEQIYIGPTGYTWTDYEMDYPWYEDRMNRDPRLEGGGGEHGKSSCSCSGSVVPASFQKSSKEGDPSVGTQDACKPRFRPDGPKPECVCPGKETSSWKRGNAKCTKKPCQGVDCLIRAFKEAQDFVDSIGKVPGLAGLGLMDPSESPYFGRDLDKDYVPQESETHTKKKGPYVSPQSAVQSSQCNAPCHVQMGKPVITGDSVLLHSPPIPVTIAVPGRTGVVREAIPTLPDTSSVIVTPKYKKKEEKKEEKLEKYKELDVTSSAPLDADIGPCGEPKCKSRRKKPAESTTQSTGHSSMNREEVIELPFKKSGMQREVKLPSTPTPKSSGKVSDKGKQYKTKTSVLGPGGDRNVHAKTSIRVSKRIMRYVYSIGDSYPGIVYGHKNCVEPRMRVPANMGWLWNTMATAGKLKPRIGWKPGAIGRYLNEMLKEAKAGSLQEANRPRSVPSRTRRPKVYKSMSFSSVKKMQTKKEGEDEVEAPPTLHIHRKDGTYYVTMYPIKQEAADVPQLAEPMKPLQFKIVKNKDDASVASSSTASDMEIEFSPPAAVTRYRRKPDVIHVDTQVRQQEILDAIKPTDSLKKKEKKVKKEKKGKK